MKFEFTAPILIERMNDKDIFIIGNAVEAGVSRNNVMYSGEELLSAAHTLIGKPLLLNHDDSDVNNIVGKIVDAKFENGSVPFKAKLDPMETKIINKIENGFIDSVSIGADYKNITEDDSGVKHPSGLEFLELSLVTVPGVKNATISQVICEKFEVKRMEDKTTELQEKIKTLEQENKTLTSEKELLATKVKEQEEAEVEETPTAPEANEDVEELKKSVKALSEKLSVIEKQPKGIVEETPKGGIGVVIEKSKKGYDILPESIKDKDGKFIY